MPGRRTNGEGTLLKRKTCPNCKKVNSSTSDKDLKLCKYCGTKLPKDGIYMVQIVTGINPETGKPKRKTLYGKTIEEVNKKKTQLLHELNIGQYFEPSEMSFGEWLDKWLKEFKRLEIEDTTYEGYEKLINLHIKPKIGNVPLANLNVHTIQHFINQQLTRGRLDGKGGMAKSSVRQMYTIINQALDKAVQVNLIRENVADAATPPTIEHKEMQTLTEDQLVSFFEAAQDRREFYAYVVAATTGLRRGELLGLSWDCVDLENGFIIIIKRQLSVIYNEVVLRERTKGKRGQKRKPSHRIVTLTDDGLWALKMQKKLQAKEKLLLGPAYQDHGLVFCKEDGTPYNPKDFTKMFQRVLKNAGLPKIRLHDLRHTHATLALKKGIHPKVVQERLGHSNIHTTLDIYSHVSPDLQKIAMAPLNGLLNKTQNIVKRKLGQSDFSK